MISSTLVTCWTGKSPGFSPLRIRPLAAGETVRLRHIPAIARQAAGSCKFPRIEDRGDAMAKRECCHLCNSAPTPSP
jgi:hypothetical protein